MTDALAGRDALAAAILASLDRWRDQLEQSELHLADCEQLLSEDSAEESARLIELGNAAADALVSSPESAVEITLRLSGSAVDAARALAIVLIARVGIFNPRTWTSLVKHMADDAATGVRDLLPLIFDARPELSGWSELHADFVLSLLEEWREDASYRVRRVVARALCGYGSQSPAQAERVIKLLAPLYEDSAEFVRRNVVSALREIGRGQPDVVLSFLEARADIKSAYDKELIPLALEGAFARKRPDWCSEILAKL